MRRQALQSTAIVCNVLPKPMMLRIPLCPGPVGPRVRGNTCNLLILFFFAAQMMLKRVSDFIDRFLLFSFTKPFSTTATTTNTTATTTITTATTAATTITAFYCFSVCVEGHFGILFCVFWLFATLHLCGRCCCWWWW